MKNEANKIRNALSSTKKTNKVEVKEDKKKEDKKAPVIIRREVIINNNEEEKEQERKKQAQKNKQMGFVERNKNADRNIVYRNKPTKPMTVSELFGIGKKEEVKRNNKTRNERRERRKYRKSRKCRKYRRSKNS